MTPAPGPRMLARMGTLAPLTGPDLELGVALADLKEGAMLLGHALGEAVLLLRRGADVFAVSGTCTHYGAPLADGVCLGAELHCPWHHARFNFQTGECIGAPAFNPLQRFAITKESDRVRVTGKLDAPAPRPALTGPEPQNVVILGAGAAGNAAAETLRREGYRGPVTMIGADPTVPVDRPNLSKDYLAGTAPEDWIPLRSPEYYLEHHIDLALGIRATELELAAHRLRLSDGTVREFGKLLIATGAEPVRLPVSGGDGPNVFVLRSLADARAVIAKAQNAKRAVVVGAGFIGLEAAASLRNRGIEVDVVAPDSRPLERVLGPALGDFIRGLHEEKGVRFHFRQHVTSVDSEGVTIDGGKRILADLVVTGIGVRPSVAIAEKAGLRVDRGILVNNLFETSHPDVFAAGDVARFPDGAGALIRVEHWAVAQEQGAAAARNILGQKKPLRRVPFFWSQHYDVPVNYVGHAEKWDRIDVAGNLSERNALIAYRFEGKIVAVATVYRDRESLLAEDALERGDQAALESLLKA